MKKTAPVYDYSKVATEKYDFVNITCFSAGKFYNGKTVWADTENPNCLYQFSYGIFHSRDYDDVYTFTDEWKSMN